MGDESGRTRVSAIDEISRRTFGNIELAQSHLKLSRSTLDVPDRRARPRFRDARLRSGDGLWLNGRDLSATDLHGRLVGQGERRAAANHSDRRARLDGDAAYAFHGLR